MKLSVLYKNRLCAGGIFLLFFALYALTAQRGVSWQDSGEFQYRLLAGDFFWNSGIARAHPLYILLGRGFISIFPYSLKLYGCSLFSGFCMSLALAVLFLVVTRVTSSRATASVATITAGFSHMCWWLSAVAEVYTLSLLFIMLELLLLYLYSQKKTARYLILLFAVNGAHFSVHNVALLALPVYGVLLIVYLLKDIKRNLWFFFILAMCWVLAGSMIWWQAVGLLNEGAGFIDVCESVLFGEGYVKHVTGVEKFNLSLFVSNMVLAAVSFVSPCWLFAPVGFFQYKKQGNALFLRALIALTLIHFLFWVRYFVPDQATFVLPLLGLLSVWCGVGCGVLQKKISSRHALIGVVFLGILVNLCFLFVSPKIAESLRSVRRSRNLPERDEWKYWLHPWKHNESSAQSFVDNVSELLSSGDILYADSTTVAPLMAVNKLESGAMSFELLSPWKDVDSARLEPVIAARHFYVVSPVEGYAPEWLLSETFSFRRQGSIFQVLKEGDSDE